MIVGVPKEVKSDEYRVALLPVGAEEMRLAGHGADEIAREYEQDYVGTEQILLAILREGTGRAVAILGKLGLDEPKIRAEIDRLIGYL